MLHEELKVGEQGQPQGAHGVAVALIHAGHGSGLAQDGSHAGGEGSQPVMRLWKFYLLKVPYIYLPTSPTWTSPMQSKLARAASTWSCSSHFHSGQEDPLKLHVAHQPGLNPQTLHTADDTGTHSIPLSCVWHILGIQQKYVEGINEFHISVSNQLIRAREATNV